MNICSVFMVALIPFTIALHESIHYITAYFLGYQPKFCVSKKGFCVIIQDFIQYKNIMEINNPSLLIDYLLIGFSPYVLLPLYYILYSTSGGILKIICLIPVLYHLYSLPIEFFQDDNSIILVSIFCNLIVLFSILL